MGKKSGHAGNGIRRQAGNQLLPSQEEDKAGEGNEAGHKHLLKFSQEKLSKLVPQKSQGMLIAVWKK